MKPPFWRRRIPAVLCVLLALAAAGCARTPKPPVVKHPPAPVTRVLPPAGAHGFYHTVTKGQTLYRISQTYQVDLKELMRLNGIQDPSQLEVGTRLFVPAPAPPVRARGGPHSDAEIARIAGHERRYLWRTITLHHSGTDRGDAWHFHRDHLRRRMGGLFYHFVIGNGSYSKDGWIETGWRWKKQVPANRANDIQICLVGNYQKQQVSEAQMASVVQLVDALRREYNVPLSGIRQHKDVKGRHTDCPGKNFPFRRVLELLREKDGRAVR